MAPRARRRGLARPFCSPDTLPARSLALQASASRTCCAGAVLVGQGCVSARARAGVPGTGVCAVSEQPEERWAQLGGCAQRRPSVPGAGQWVPQGLWRPFLLVKPGPLGTSPDFPFGQGTVSAGFRDCSLALGRWLLSGARNSECDPVPGGRPSGHAPACVHGWVLSLLPPRVSLQSHEPRLHPREPCLHPWQLRPAPWCPLWQQRLSCGDLQRLGGGRQVASQRAPGRYC